MPAQFTTRTESDPVAIPALATETAAREALAVQVADLEDQVNSAGVVDKTYRHQQMVAAEVWTVPHGLGKRPAVDIFDSGGDVVLTEIEHIDDDNLTITFSAATGGEAYLN